jgi:hypothetical protein
MMTIIRADLDPSTDPAWELAAKEFGTLFNSPPWIRAISSAFDIPIRALLHADGPHTQGFLIADIDDACGVRRSTLPFSDYCDPLQNGGPPDWAVLNHVIEQDIPYTTRIRCLPHAQPPDSLEPQAEFAWHTVGLERAIHEIWDELPSNARQGVRKAQRMGATAGAESADSLDEFHRLHVGLRATKFHMLAQPLEYFTALGREFGAGDLALISARSDSELVAGVVLLKWGDVAYYKFNASRVDGMKMHANDLCMWTAINYAKEEWGCSTLDLGLSDLDQPGLLRYKDKYATDVGRLRTYRNRAAREATPSPVRSLVNSTVELVTSEGVPEEVRMYAASTFYRYFC